MATAHLCSKDTKSGTGAARYPLIANGSDLLIIVKNTQWTNKELVITPDDELYFMAATYGRSDRFSYTASGVFADGVTMSNRLNSMMTSATVSSWQTGHKPTMHYVARSCCPWMIKTKTGITTDDILKTLEYGGCWNARKLNCYGLPVGKASSFKAYLRCWNGTVINTGPELQYAFPVYMPGHSTCKYFDYQYNHAGDLRFNFSKDLMPPSQYVADGYGNIDVSLHANNNQRTSDQGRYYIEYDLYSSHLSVADTKKNYYNDGYQNFRIFANGASDKSPYKWDYEITGTALTKLKECIANGSFWMYTGYKMADICSQSGISAAMDPFHTMVNYISRIELVFVLTMPKINA